MMHEIEKERDVGSVGYRRRFSDSVFDLTVWYNIEGRLAGFRLSRFSGNLRGYVEWTEEAGYSANVLAEAGRGGDTRKVSADIINAITDEFKQTCGSIDSAISEFVCGRLECYKC